MLSRHDLRTSPKKIADAERDNEAIIERLAREEKEALYNSTAAKLQRIREEQLVARHDAGEISAAKSLLVAAAPQSPDRDDLTEKILDCGHREHSFRLNLRESGLSVKTEHIAANATEVFRKQFDDAKDQIAKLLRPFRGSPNASPGPRILSEVRELESLINDWPTTERLCKVGEKIHSIRQEQSNLEAERSAMDEAREREALAV